MGNLDFDASGVPPTAPFDPVPSGDYVCRIKNTEKKAAKDKPGKPSTGSYLNMQFEIIDGQFKGRQVFGRINLWNTSQQAVDIARGELSAICHAVGLIKVRNHEELRNKTLLVKVNKKNDPDYGEQNEVKGYKLLPGTVQAQVATEAPAGEATAPAQPQASAPATPAQTAGGSDAPPWSR